MREPVLELEAAVRPLAIAAHTDVLDALQLVFAFVIQEPFVEEDKNETLPFKQRSVFDGMAWIRGQE